MTATPDHDPEAVAEDALLAAYLAGETDDVTTARIEGRLADDADLSARLDALAEARGRLQRLSTVRAPDTARQRLRAQLASEPDPRRRRADRSRPRWLAPAAAAAVALALLGVGSLLGPLAGGEEEAGSAAHGVADAEGNGGASDLQAAGEADAGDTAAGADDAGGGDGAGAVARSAPEAAAQVDSDADIAARLDQLRQRAPQVDPRVRERRLRRRAQLPAARLCVRDLDVAAVDLVDEDGRVTLAVLLRGPTRQIVLLDPRTCVPSRTIAAPPR